MMIKRLINSALAALIILAASASGNAADFDRWTVFPVFAAGEKRVADTGDRVYFANTGLFYYDNATGEQHSYGEQLTGNDIREIYYNADRGYLFVAYSDANIDLVYDDGRVVNMPQISISEQMPCQINDVVFDGRYIYVATTFGIVKIDESTHEIKESGIFRQSVSGLAVAAGHLLMHTGSYLYTLPLESSIHNMGNFSRLLFCGPAVEVCPLSDSCLLIRTDSRSEYALRLYTVNIPAGEWLGDREVYNVPVPRLIHAGGKVCAIIDGKMYSFDAQGNQTLEYTIPEGYETDVIDASDSPSAIWCLGETGLTNIEVQPGGGVTVMTDRFKPDAFYTKEVDFFAPSASGKEVYVYNYGKSVYKPFSTTHESPLTATLLNLKNNSTSDATPYPVKAVSSTAQEFQNVGGLYPLNTSMIAVDPDNASTYYLATGNDGIYKITDGKRTGYFDDTNSPMARLWGPNTFGVHVDRGGNLWMVTYQNGESGSSLAVLPSAMRARPTSEVKKSDWIVLDDGGFTAASDVAFLECQRSGMIFIASHGANFQLLAYDTNNTPSNFNDDKCYLWTSMTDQDGKKWEPERRVCLTEDLNGRVWFGTNLGIYQITSPKQATNATMRFQKLKVPRNDGTNEADYLLDNDLVYGISVDSRNRKWIASENSGLVCANESGNAILARYTPENSPLLTNRVLSVWADRSTDDIYIGTLYGPMVYNASVASATDTYDDILAYPNPVKPDYFGPVYVRGLMENSLVKIADAAGGVVAQGRAENGIFRWDACDQSGQRVKTGVYYVFASQNTNGTSAAVTKIMVIN